MAKLVLLPGMDGTGDLFAPFLENLGAEQDVTVVRYPLDKPLDYHALEAIARAALPASGPYVLLGESFSGPIAVSLAASQPSGLSGLVLCCTFVRNPRPFFAGLRFIVGVLPLVRPPMALLSKLLLGKFSTAQLRAALADALAKVAPDALRARLQAVLRVDVSAHVQSIKVPMLYLGASEDLVVPRTAADVISRLQPSMKVVEVKAPHFLLQAAPAEAARVVRGFFETTVGVRRHEPR